MTRITLNITYGYNNKTQHISVFAVVVNIIIIKRVYFTRWIQSNILFEIRKILQRTHNVQIQYNLGKSCRTN